MSDSHSPQSTPAEGTPGPTRGRNLVLCFDGTSNQFRDEKNTNVVLLFQMLEKNKPKEQLVYYQTGIGTYTPPGFMSTLARMAAQLMDEAFASYMQDHVMDGYRYLMDTYEEGDQICLFGYSRGAYTARALAAMLFRVGLLPRKNVEQVPFAYKIFKESIQELGIRKNDPSDPRGRISRNFRRTFSRNVRVEFVGVWDTVSSVGLIPQRLPNTEKNPIVKHVRHALALDERRAKFQASYWNSRQISRNAIGKDEDGQKGFKADEQTVEEVWFAGGHGDVGGGWEGTSQKFQLSRIPLRWMVREAKACSSILWDEGALQNFRVEKPKSTDVESLAKYINQENQDAISKSHSAFTEPSSSRVFWWILELIPLWISVNILGHELNIFGPHWFRARKIRKPEYGKPTKVHSSVKTRLNHFPGGYVNAAKWDPELIEFVDE